MTPLPFLLYNSYLVVHYYKKESEGRLTARSTLPNLGIMKNYTKFTALITTTLLTVALAGPANATGPEPQEPTVETASMPVLAPVKASPTASVAFEKPAVKTVAYVAPAPAPVVVAAAPVVQAPVAVKATPAAQPKASAPVAAAPTPAAPVASASGRGAALLASAYNQIGITQDCTAMVERALGSIGIVTGDIAPNDFFRFGTVVGNPLPGDIMISAGHVGIYAGNGQMVSGGFNGSQTVLHPVKYVGAASYVRVA